MLVDRAWRWLPALCLPVLLAGCIDSETAYPPEFLNDEATVTFEVNIEKVSGNFSMQALAAQLKSPDAVIEGRYLPSKNVWLLNADIEVRWPGLLPIPSFVLAPRMKRVPLHAKNYQIIDATHLRFQLKRELSAYYVLHGIRIALPESTPILNWPSEPFDLQVNLVSPETDYPGKEPPPPRRQQLPFVYFATRYAASGTVSASNAYIAVDGDHILADVTTPAAQAALVGSRYAGYQNQLDKQLYVEELPGRVIFDASEVYRRQATANDPDAASSATCDCAPTPEQQKATLDEYKAWLAKYRAAQNVQTFELVLTRYPDAPPKEQVLAQRHLQAKVEGHLLDYLKVELRHGAYNESRRCQNYSTYTLFFVDRRMVDYARQETVCTPSDEEQVTTLHAKWDDQGHHVYLHKKCEYCAPGQDVSTEQDTAAWQSLESFGAFIARDVLTTPDVTGLYKTH